MFTRKYTRLALALLLVSSFFTVCAETGPFIEGNLGYSTTGNSTLNNLDSSNAQHFAWNVNAGVMIFSLGAEVGYTHYGPVTYSDHNNSTTANLSSYHLALRKVVDVGPLFLLGKLGYGQLNRGDFSVNNVSVNSASAGGLFWGVGAGIKLSPFWRTQVEYQQIQGNNNAPTANALTIGLGWTFL